MFTIISNYTYIHSNMKTFFKSIVYLSFAGLLWTSCAKNDDFTVPSLDNCKEVNLTPNKTILDVTAVSSATTLKQYTENDIISGVVVSSDAGGNFYKDLYIVSEDGQFSARIKINKSGTTGSYPVGRVIYIKLKDLYTKIDNDVLTIGTKEDGSAFVGALTDYKTSIFRSCKTVTGEEFEKKFNNKVTLQEAISTKYLGKLVTISDVQFKEEFRGKLFWDENNLVSATNRATNVGIESKVKVGENVIFRVAEQAHDFAQRTVPAKSGSMTGVMTKFSKDYQFVPRKWADLNLELPTFKSGDPEGPVDPEEPGDIVVEPGKFLAFPGADFEDWDKFLASIYKNALSDASAQKADGQGWNNSRGLAVKGTRTANGFLFSVEKVKMPTDATKVSFLMKGTSAKSLSVNVYKANGVNYYAYNLENFTTSKVIQPNMTETVFNGVPSGNTTNVYTGKIDTQGKWVKVVLDLSALNGDFHTAGTGSFIGFRSGNNAEYDLVIDEIRFEDGTPVNDDNGGENPGGETGESLGNLVFFGSDFKNWNDFDAASYDDKITPDRSVYSKGNGNGPRAGENALIINHANVVKNPYVFTAKNISGKDIATGKTKIVFWIKGTASKSLSINVYGPDEESTPNQHGDKFSAFNLGSINGSSDVTVSGAKSNSYTGSIDTNGAWTKVILDLSTLKGAYNSADDKPILSLKIGGSVAWDNFLVSGFTFE